MISYQEHFIDLESKIEDALIKLNSLGKDAILFVVDLNLKLIGSITDGDVRRGLLKGITIEKNIKEILQPYPHFFRSGNTDIKKVIELRENNFRIIPVLDNDDRVVKIINFRNNKSYLPIDAIIMAGGIGQRLMPLTKNIPKPLLLVGDKPIIEHNISRLKCFGIDNYWVSLKYLGNQIQQYLNRMDLNINFVWEEEPLGTIGAVSKIKDLVHDYVIICNSDILTNLDYEHFFLNFLENDADMAIVSIPYKVNIPYAVLETTEGKVNDLKEKPTYTYYSNGGIYLVKKKLLDFIPKDIKFDATDFIEQLIKQGYRVISYPLTGYWLDIGSHEDFIKAQNDIKHINF